MTKKFILTLGSLATTFLFVTVLVILAGVQEAKAHKIKPCEIQTVSERVVYFSCTEMKFAIALAAYLDENPDIVVESTTTVTHGTRGSIGHVVVIQSS